MTAPILYFYYKKNAGTNDTFRFKIDGDTKLSVSRISRSWQQWSSQVTGAGSHTLQWHYSKGGSGTTADGGVWVDLVEWDPDDDSTPTLAESLDCDYTITTGGDQNWSNTTSGAYHDGDCAKSGDISKTMVSHLIFS